MTRSPLWRIRLTHELPRYLVCALSISGLLASARFAIAPPRPTASAAPVRTPPPPDLAAEGYASLFARRYLTWNAAEPEASQHALAALVGSGMEPDAGLRPPQTGEQHVDWAEVVQERESAPGQRVYTVAAQTDTAGLLYLTVSIGRTSDGSLALAGYPAFVGAPSSSPAQVAARPHEVGDPALATVVERALRNYLAASAGELAADLTSDARISLPAVGLSLLSMQRIDWLPDGRSVLAIVQAQDGRGAQYTLGYELDVALAQGRWEVSAIQMDPDT
ncbi:MAG: conjugal transfer protein [Solirubrobacterales bacterium]